MYLGKPTCIRQFGEYRLTDSAVTAGFRADRGELRINREADTEHLFNGARLLEKWVRFSIASMKMNDLVAEEATAWTSRTSQDGR